MKHRRLDPLTWVPLHPSRPGNPRGPWVPG